MIVSPPKPPAEWLNERNTDSVPTLSEHVELARLPVPNLESFPGLTTTDLPLMSAFSACTLASKAHGLGSVAAETALTPTTAEHAATTTRTAVRQRRERARAFI